MLRNDNGFSLLEITVVVICLLILAGIAVPNWLQTTWPIYRLKGAAQQIIADIRHAKMSAVTTNKPYRIVISPKTNSYSIQKSVFIGGSQKWEIDYASQHFGAGLPGDLPKDIHILSVSVATLLIKPTGNISATTIMLQNSNGQKIKITCSMAGRIRMERIV
jgi:prepilin-type N-terminal cleavage/methylation domain-containing protein